MMWFHLRLSKREQKKMHTESLFVFINKLLNDLIASFPPNERKKGYAYSEREYRTKK